MRDYYIITLRPSVARARALNPQILTRFFFFRSSLRPPPLVVAVGLRHQDLSTAAEQRRDQSQPVHTAESNSDARQFGE